MSEMSFKQAKELVERMEFSEISIKKSIDHLEKASNDFEISLKVQEEILNRIPYMDKKLTIMKVAVAINIGVIIGIFIGKYLL
ncbi:MULTISPECIES: tetrahydromethanopterin S-methyltransferase subunit B [Arcobacteraceae]|uniref:Uncharacterized protein n=3 Tax=Arcobacteraceae TaxID=2808963 RepID=A0A1C0B7Y2_9BACT|nr:MULTISPECIES: tetrahydromethanopterin S-methyltransferase subunit B [Arcobacteraceae]OCL83762.1 hypothetical protein AAW29_00588 [Arcobacter porcinus]OCL87741.1 hypothetical protein AAX26_00829 [Aliarcobacter thereius]OCL87959.1 hypothetical protein AAX30_00566 [Arcobacter porcinus]OCL93998.1 hypothetical protein AAX25_00320 [Aliarcobacter thereius]OCL94395.1 hypothetical protein AAX27_00953 [Aliarcobacter thereius]